MIDILSLAYTFLEMASLIELKNPKTMYLSEASFGIAVNFSGSTEICERVHSFRE